MMERMEATMEVIQNQKMDEERALYGRNHITIDHCAFDGPLDGESAIKECRDVTINDTYFNLRYPLWHVHGLTMKNSEMTPNCRAALWYSDHIRIDQTKMHGIKALRECCDVTIKNCDIDSPEFGWFTHGLTIEHTTIQGEYLFMRSTQMHINDMKMKGKYSFQYIENVTFENCEFDTKDAFWHGKNVTLKNCVVKGEYLAWYSDHITFDHCTIIGTQPLCYCTHLTLIDCAMIDTDLAFEKSEVNATITTHVISIKNPYDGLIIAPSVGEIIKDDERSTGKIEIKP